MRALVAYGSKMGGTQGLAEMVGRALEERAFTVDVRPAADVPSVESYDVVVIGGALYAMRWHREARRFVRRLRDELRDIPVWFFSSGPLDDSAATKEIPPVRQVRSLMGRVDARGHATFGGRLVPDPPGFMARSMAKKLSGDWRDAAHVERWVDSITTALSPEGETSWP
jgi:menaquinone-dependent protoporphyrinogen oxidase